MGLNNNIKKKLYGYFKTKLRMYNYRRGWMKGDCPECGAHKYGVNIGQNRTNCFKCGYNDKPIYVVGNVEDIESYSDIVKYIQGFKFDGEVYEVKQEVKNYSLSPGALPEDYLSISRTENKMGKRVQEYLKGRGFNIESLIARGWGYCYKGDYAGYIIIPYYFDNKLIYFTARRLAPIYGPKFNNPKVEDFGIGKAMLIYNHEALQIEERVFMVESATNAETIGDQAFGIGGKAISRYQLNEVIKSDCEKVIIILDPDAYKEAIETALKIVDFKKVKVVKLPDGADVNDIGRKRTMYYVHKTNYMNRNQLIRLKNA